MSVEIFTKDEFEETINEVRSGWEGAFEFDEWKYSLEFGDNGRILINSSIGENDQAKAAGQDSIRIWVEYNGRALKKTQRWTTRLPGWRDRLRERILDACKAINDLDYSPRCPLCGGTMVLRSGVHGKFYGCLQFPKCRGTRNYEEELPEELKWLR